MVLVFPHLVGLYRCSRCICLEHCPPAGPCRCHAASTNSLHTVGRTHLFHINATLILKRKQSLQCLKNRCASAHLNHEVILFLHLTDTSHNLLVTCIDSTRVHTQGRRGDIQIHPKVIVAPSTAVCGPVTDAVLIYSTKDKQSYRFFMGTTTKINYSSTI